MHEVTGSSPVVPTKKTGDVGLPFFFASGARARTYSPQKSDVKKLRAGRRFEQPMPCRGFPLGYGIALLSPPRKAPLRRCFFRGTDDEPLAARTRSPRQGRLPLHDFDFACAALLVRCGKFDYMKRARSLRPRPCHFGEDHSSSSASVSEG